MFETIPFSQQPIETRVTILSSIVEETGTELRMQQARQIKTDDVERRIDELEDNLDSVMREIDKIRDEFDLQKGGAIREVHILERD